jgi:uncharacterized protein (TIGR00725 family)
MRTIVGVMGGAIACDAVLADARRLGALIAENGWVLLTGGRNSGVMAAASAGASVAGGLVVGVLPGDSADEAAPGVDIAIPTGMGDARNAINVLASRVVVALPGGAGTISEVALALKAGRPVVLLGMELGAEFGPYYAHGRLVEAATPDAALDAIKDFIAREVAP